MNLTNARWLIKKKEGLYCIPGKFFIDPIYPVNKALITHAHTDHARPNNKFVLSTPETIEIMKIRYGQNFCDNFQTIKYNQKLNNELSGLNKEKAELKKRIGKYSLVKF